jgi:hypothetical protein
MAFQMIVYGGGFHEVIVVVSAGMTIRIRVNEDMHMAASLFFG